MRYLPVLFLFVITCCWLQIGCAEDTSVTTPSSPTIQPNYSSTPTSAVGVTPGSSIVTNSPPPIETSPKVSADLQPNNLSTTPKTTDSSTELQASPNATTGFVSMTTIMPLSSATSASGDVSTTENGVTSSNNGTISGRGFGKPIPTNIQNTGTTELGSSTANTVNTMTIVPQPESTTKSGEVQTQPQVQTTNPSAQTTPKMEGKESTKLIEEVAQSTKEMSSSYTTIYAMSSATPKTEDNSSSTQSNEEQSTTGVTGTTPEEQSTTIKLTTTPAPTTTKKTLTTIKQSSLQVTPKMPTKGNDRVLYIYSLYSRLPSKKSTNILVGNYPKPTYVAAKPDIKLKMTNPNNGFRVAKIAALSNKHRNPGLYQKLLTRLKGREELRQRQQNRKLVLKNIRYI